MRNFIKHSLGRIKTAQIWAGLTPDERLDLLTQFVKLTEPIPNKFGFKPGLYTVWMQVPTDGSVQKIDVIKAVRHVSQTWKSGSLGLKEAKDFCEGIKLTLTCAELTALCEVIGKPSYLYIMPLEV